MDSKQIISIDFGSAYTKVGVRKGWNADAGLVDGLRLAQPDLDFCVPSIIANVKRGGDSIWLSGVEAAGQVPGDGVTIYTDWKSNFFATRDAKLGDDGGPHGYDRVAVEFFRSLRQGVLTRLGQDSSDLPVRVCVPKLEGLGRPVEGLCDVLTQAGWTPATQKPTLYEPESNFVGVLSRGRNATWLPPGMDFQPLPGRSPFLPEMFEGGGLLAGLRQAALRETKGYYGVLVLDVGAFTTDIAYVRFETGFFTDEWNKPLVSQQSFRLGVGQLDADVKTRLRRDAQDAIARSSSANWEAQKKRLYEGKEVAFLGPSGARVEVGGRSDRAEIDQAIRDFASEVLNARASFIDSHVSNDIHAESLTGGGVMIPLLREAVVKGIRRKAGHPIYDLLDKAEPRRAISKVARGLSLE